MSASITFQRFARKLEQLHPTVPHSKFHQTAFGATLLLLGGRQEAGGASAPHLIADVPLPKRGTASILIE